MSIGLVLVTGSIALLLSPPALGRHPFQQRARPLLASADDGPGDFDSADFQVVLRDPETDLSMECYLLETTDALGSLYASMTPVDTPVAMTLLQDGIMIEIDDEELVETLFPTASAVCSEMGLALLRTPVTLTVSGELSDDDSDSEGSARESLLNSMEELDEVDEVGEDEEDEGAEVLLSFFHDSRKYYLVRLLEPIFVVGKQVQITDFVIPSDDEMDAVGPVLEELMQQNAEQLETE